MNFVIFGFQKKRIFWVWINCGYKLGYFWVISLFRVLLKVNVQNGYTEISSIFWGMHDMFLGKK